MVQQLPHPRLVHATISSPLLSTADVQQLVQHCGYAAMFESGKRGRKQVTRSHELKTLRLWDLLLAMVIAQVCLILLKHAAVPTTLTQACQLTMLACRPCIPYARPTN
jgi:hypothetical protein